MSKSVNLLARTGEEIVCVGRCHPGEGRLLRKNGFAEWSNDHGGLMLNLSGSSGLAEAGDGDGVSVIDTSDAPIPPELLESLSDLVNSRLADPSTLISVMDDTDPDPDTVQVRAMTGGWNPAQSFTVGDDGNPVPAPHRVEEITCKTVREWFEHVAEGRRSGHTLYPCDDPMARQFGFVVDELNVAYKVSLFRSRSLTDSDVVPLAEFGLDLAKVQQLMRTELGHYMLLGCTDLTFARSTVQAEAMKVLSEDAEALPSPMHGALPGYTPLQITPDELESLVDEATTGTDWFAGALARSVARDHGIIPMDSTAAEVYEPPAPDAKMGEAAFPATSEDWLLECGSPQGWFPYDEPLCVDNRFTFCLDGPKENFSSLPRIPAIATEIDDPEGSEDTLLVFRADRTLGIVLPVAGHLTWDQKAAATGLTDRNRDAKGALKTVLHRSGFLHGSKLKVVPWPVQPATPKGWSKFTYPGDFDRIPLYDGEGKKIDRAFDGLFRRVRGGLWIIPQGGNPFFAPSQNVWTLAGVQGGPDGSRVTGYVVPDGASFDDQGVPVTEAVEAAQKALSSPAEG